MQIITIAAALLLTTQGHQTIITQDPDLSIEPSVLNSFTRCSDACVDVFKEWHRSSNDTRSPLEAIMVNKPFSDCVEDCQDTFQEQTGARPSLVEISQTGQSKSPNSKQNNRRDKNRFNRRK